MKLDTRSWPEPHDKYVPYGGGVDLASSPRAIKPGRLTQCLNFEEAFGFQGYRSIYGYERKDGRTSPSSQTYYTQPFDAGSIAIVAGETVTNATTATGEVVSVTLTSGSWAGGDAAGYLILTLVDDTWTDNDPIRVGGIQRALASDDSAPGTQTDDDYETNLAAAYNAVRAHITKVPGDGSVLGVAVYRATVYAVRNIVGSLSATLWKTSAAGWVSVKTGLIPSGAWEFVVANFSGASTTLALFGVDGKNRLLKYDGTTVTQAAPIYGSEATSTSNITIGTGAKVFTVEAARSWVAGDALVIWSQVDAANSMIGTVTSLVGTTLTVNVTAVTGAGTLASWQIGRADFQDKPYLLTEHKDHMFLGYPLGQLQTSNLGDPMVYTTTAALFGLGADITGLTSMKGTLLGVFCREKISLLSGSSSLDWVMNPHSKGAGAILGTVVDNVGNALFLDDKGVLSLQATQAYGGFEPGILSRDVKPFLDARIGTVIGARMVKGTNQYRLYFADGTLLRFTIMSGNPVLQPRDVSATRQEYPHIPTCFATGIMEDDAEAMFFGTTDGYVMQEDKGPSFDGEAIEFVMRTAFGHYDTPSKDKQFGKLDFELDSPDAITVSFRMLFDYDDGVRGASESQDAEVIGKGGAFDVSMFDTFRYDLPVYSRAEVNVEGTGQNMALLIYITTATARQFTFQGLTAQFFILGTQR
jgi:hypothetical protein